MWEYRRSISHCNLKMMAGVFPVLPAGAESWRTLDEQGLVEYVIPVAGVVWRGGILSIVVVGRSLRSVRSCSTGVSEEKNADDGGGCGIHWVVNVTV